MKCLPQNEEVKFFLVHIEEFFEVKKTNLSQRDKILNLHLNKSHHEVQLDEQISVNFILQ